MNLVVMKEEQGYAAHAILADTYQIENGVVLVRGNIGTVESFRLKLKEGSAKTVAPKRTFLVPLSNVALIAEVD